MGDGEGVAGLRRVAARRGLFVAESSAEPGRYDLLPVGLLALLQAHGPGVWSVVTTSRHGLTLAEVEVLLGL